MDDVALLVDDLAAFDPDRRSTALAALDQLGPAARPYLEDLRDQVEPFAARGIDTLLAYADFPTLGGLLPLEGPTEVVSRLPGFGVIVRFGGGIEYEEVAGIGVVIEPAYVLLRPGTRITLLDRDLVGRLEAGDQIVGIGGDFIAIGDKGPGIWGINHFRPLLRDEQAATWTKPLARDGRGRWLFGSDDKSARLLVDPRLPAAATSLPVWVLETGTAGPLQVPGMAGRGPTTGPLSSWAVPGSSAKQGGRRCPTTASSSASPKPCPATPRSTASTTSCTTAS